MVTGIRQQTGTIGVLQMLQACKQEMSRNTCERWASQPGKPTNQIGHTIDKRCIIQFETTQTMNTE
jgi:hypothetical protein